MENKPRRRARKPQVDAPAADVSVTAPVIDKQSELINEKVSQIISLQNGLNANERMLTELNARLKEFSSQVTDLKAENVRIRTLHNNLDYNLKRAYEQLSKLPNFVKWIYKIN